MRCLALLLVVAAVAVMANSPPRYPGLKFKITNKLLDGIKSVMRKIAEKRATSLPQRIPSGVLPAGLKVTGVEVKEHDMSNADLTFAAPNLLKLTATGGKVVLEATVKKGDVEGKATATVDNVDVDIAIAFGRNGKHLTLSKQTCSITIGAAALKIEGFGDNAEIDQFSQQAAMQMQQLLPAMMCPQMEMGMTVATAYISMAPTSLPLMGGLAMDMGLMQDPVATDTYLEFVASACTHLIDQPSDSCMSNPIDDKGDISRMFHFYSTEAASNVFFRKFHEQGLLSIKVDKNSDPAKYARAQGAIKRMSVDMGGTVYNENDDIEVSIKSLEAPTMDMKVENDEKHPKLHLKLQLETKVRPGQDDEKIYKVDIAATGKMHAKFNETKEGESVPKLDYHVDILSLDVSNIEGVELTPEKQTMAAEKLKQRVQKFINKKMKEFQDYDNKMMKKFGKIGKVTNPMMKMHDRTFEMAFDIEVDVDAIFEEARKKLKPAGL